MNSIETPLDPTLLQQRADLARDRLATLGYWRDHLAELDLVVAELKEIATENWYVAAQAWRTARSDAPLPAFLDPRTDRAFELRLKMAERGIFLEGFGVEAEPALVDVQSLEASVAPPAQVSAANDPDAKKAANEPVKPVAEHISDRDLERLRGIRAMDRERAEALLRERSAQAQAEQSNAIEFGAQANARAVPGADASDEDAGTPAPRPVLQKTGYEIPKSVAAHYVSFDGKFLDRLSEVVHFEDHGKKLTTESEDRAVITHMVEVAKAKNWGMLELKGTEEFRRQAWIAAEVAGMPSRGFKPSAEDRAMAQAAREAMRIGPASGAAPGDPAQSGLDVEKGKNTIESAAADRSQEPTPSKRKGTANRSTAPKHETSRGRRRDAEHRRGASAGTTKSDQRGGVTEGVLRKHGPARFEHDPRNNPSYFVTVDTAQGERTVWGLDLERAIAASGFQPGQRVRLERGGSKAVQALERQFDESGNELPPKPVESKRNEWIVTSPDAPERNPKQSNPETREADHAPTGAPIPTHIAAEIEKRRTIVEARDRFMRGELNLTDKQKEVLDAARERIKERAARQVMEDSIQGLRPQDQEIVRGEFERAVADARANNQAARRPDAASERTHHRECAR